MNDKGPDAPVTGHAPDASDIPAPDVTLHFLDDSGVLFSPTAQEIYALNPLATFIWCRLEEGDRLAQITDRVAGTFAIAPADASRQVREIAAQWRRLGLLAGDRISGNGIVPKAEEARALVPEMPPHVAPAATTSRSYRLLSTLLSVRFTAPEHECLVHPVLAHLKSPQTAPADTVIDIISANGGAFVYRDGTGSARVDAPDRIAPWVKSLFLQRALERYDYLLQIHAGVVGTDGGCILLPGAPGCGKTTLTIALVDAGLPYFSDEVALLERGTLAVRPVPLALGIKSTGWDTAGRFVPEFSELAIHHRIDGKILRYVPPAAIGRVADPHIACPVRAIIFPRYDPDAPAGLLPVDRVTGLQRLMAECLTIPGRLETDDVANLVAWSKQLAFFEARYPNSDAAVRLVKSIQ